MTIHGLRSKNKDPVTSSWLPMKGMKPGFQARTMFWSSTTVTAPGKKSLVDAWLLLFPLHVCDEVFMFGTPGSHVSANQTSICCICHGGVGCEGPKSVGGKSLRCVMLRAPITPIMIGGFDTYIEWFDRLYPFSRFRL